MKKAIVFVAALLAVIPMASAVAEAKSGYLSSVNTTCETNYNCNLCHGSNYSLNSTAQTYQSGNYDECVICPNAAACGGPVDPPPVTDCTDFDKDGFYAEQGCAQLYDCVDSNSNIYPGATEICNDGIDQDCSGADKRKGKGCRQRK